MKSGEIVVCNSFVSFNTLISLPAKTVYSVQRVFLIISVLRISEVDCWYLTDRGLLKFYCRDLKSVTVFK